MNFYKIHIWNLVSLIAILLITGLLMRPALLSAQVPSATASRDIANQSLAPGATTQVTVTFTSLLSETRSFSLQENIPAVWTLTLGTESPTANAFNPNTNEWVWFSLPPGATATVTYTLTMPLAATASYSISGIVTANNIINNVVGETTITAVSATASRDIAIQTLNPGATTRVTINFTSLLSQAKTFGLRENIPGGWTMTLGTEVPAANAFNPFTNEWVWFSFPAGATATVIYNLTAPAASPVGSFSISGIVLASDITNSIGGESTINIILNVLPVVSILQPAAGTYNASTISLIASASDADGTISNVQFLYSRAPYATWTSIGSGTFTSGTTASGTWTRSWNTATVPDGIDYKLKAAATDDQGGIGEGVSIASFAVDNNPPSVTVSSPNGGQFLMGGSTITITWTATDANMAFNPISIHYATDGATWNLIATNEANNGSFAWTVPSINSATVRVRVTAVDNAGNSASDASDANFTIDSTIPSVAVTFPNGGEFLKGGSSVNITWTATDANMAANPISLAYATDGVTWIQIATNEVNDGFFIWITPLIDSTTVRARVTAIDKAGNSASDVSNANFIIDSTPPAAPTLLSPANGATDHPLRPTFMWTVPPPDTSGIASYRLRVANNASLAPAVVDQAGITGTFYTLASILNAVTTYYWSVSATDGAGNAGAFATPAFSFITVNKVTQTATWQAGWVMFGLDVEPDPNTFTGQLGDDISGALNIFHYFPSLGQYQLVSTGRIASAYWINLNSTVNIDIEGFPASTATNYYLAIGNGWNMIANPFKNNRSWVAVNVIYQGQKKTIVDAHGAGWVSQYIFNYNTVDKKYQVDDVLTGVLKSLVGYWVKSNVSGAVLEIPPP